MSTVRSCDDHGFFDSDACPICGADGQHVIDGERRRRLSKFLSGVLRHFPDDAGLELDDAGWTAFDDLVRAATDKYDWATREHVAAVVATDPKGRFERTGIGAGTGRVRAAYGHSVAVDLETAETPVPDTLYHGTAPSALDSIEAEGIKPMSRQHVHLSATETDAIEVGQRHADDPVLLEVDAAAMLEDGHEITKRGRAVYTTDGVPPAYLTVRSDGE